jgi:hypothetical protein
MHAHNQTFPHNWSTLVQTSHKIECDFILSNMKKLSNDQGRLIVDLHGLEIVETCLHMIQATINLNNYLLQKTPNLFISWNKKKT